MFNFQGFSLKKTVKFLIFKTGRFSHKKASWGVFFGLVGVALTLTVASTVWASHLTPSVLTGGGPANSQENVPPEAQVDVVSTVDLEEATAENTSNVLLRECSGADQSTSSAACGTDATPTVSASNLCQTLVYDVSSKRIQCLHAPLATSKWHEFRLTTGLQASGHTLNQAVVRRFKVSTATASNNTSPPRVIATYPSSGLLGVPLNATLTVDFPRGPEGVMNAANSSKGWAAGASGKIRFTTNGGTSWSSNTSGVSITLNAIKAFDVSFAYAVGDNGTILITDDGGVTWRTMTSGVSDNLNGLYIVNSSIIYIVGNGGKILKTTNRGMTWTNQTSGVSEQLNSIACADANTCWAVGVKGSGDNGKILKTVNGGTTWASQTNTTGNDLNVVAVFDVNTAYVGGDSSTIFKTVNGGTSWTQVWDGTICVGQDCGGTSVTVRGLTLLNATTVVAVGNSGTIVKTTNSGTSWTQQDSASSDALYGVVFTDANTGYIAGAIGALRKTTNGGTTTWLAQNSGVLDDLRGLAFASSTPNAITSVGAVSLKKIVNFVPSTEVCTSSSACNIEWNASARRLSIDPAANLDATSEYEFCVRGTGNANAAQNQYGQTLTSDFCVQFTTAATADNSAPVLRAATPTVPASGATTISRFAAPLVVGFSEAMDPSTINAGRVRLYIDDGNGSGSIAGNGIKEANETGLTSTELDVRYESVRREATITPKIALTANKRYCFDIVGGGQGVKDVAGNALNPSIQNLCFTTVSDSDLVAPKVSFVDGDAFKVVLRFSEIINNSDVTDTTKYTLTCPVNSLGQGPGVPLTGKTLSWRPDIKEIEIQGLGLPPGQNCRLAVASGASSGMRDRDGNRLTNANDAFADFSVQDGSGFVGTGNVVTGGNFFEGMGGMTAATFWEKPMRCEPRNRATNKETVVECEFPLPTGLTLANSQTASLILTFPSDFAIGSVAAVTAAQSFMNKDLNGSGPGTTTISSVTVDGAAATVTVGITHSGDTQNVGDMLRFELSGITTPATPATSQRISIAVKNSSGVKVGQTIQPAPFDISQAGALTISGKICKGATAVGTCGGGDTAIENVKVICAQKGGFMVGATAGAFMGHQEATTNASGDWSITGLTSGEYDCNLPPQPSVLQDVIGFAPFQKVSLSNANKTGVDFKLKDLSSVGAGVTLNVSITGMNDADATADDADIFCHAGGYDFESSMPVMRALDWATSGATTATLTLQPEKKYECGVGPHIAFESFQGGGPPPIPDFEFMPPKLVRIVTTANAVQNESGTTMTAQSPLTFAIGNANLTIVGRVVDGSNNNIANVFIHAFPVNCSDAATGLKKECLGGFAQSTSASGTSNNFTLRVSPGTYEVGADGPGLPPSTREEVTVKSDGTLTKEGTTITAVTLKMVKSSTTISGQILDESGNGIKYAHVSAEKRTITSGSDACDFSNTRPSGGLADSPTDESGNFTLYASAGTWCLRAFAPAYGEVGTKTVIISSGTSSSGQNIQASSANYGTISGTITKGGTATAGAFVNCFSAESGAGGNGTQSSVDGTWSLKVRLSTDHSGNGTVYTCDGFLPGNGPLGQQTVTVASSATSVTGVTLSMGNPGTVNITIAGITDGFVDLRDATGRGHGTGQNSNGVYTLKVPAGTYTVRAGGPKYGELCSGQSVTVTAGNTSAVTCSAPANLRTVTGTIQAGGANLAGTTVTFTERATGRAFKEISNAVTSGANLSASNIPDGTYNVTVTKKGYEPATTTATISSGSTALSSTVTLTQATGTSGTSVTIPVQESSTAYTGEATVIATKTESGITKTVVAQLDSTTGNVTLPITNGTWTVKAVGDNGKESSSSSIIIINGAVSGSTPTLSLATAITGYTAKNQSETLALSTGGLLKYKDLAVGSVSPEVNIPANTLSTSDSSTGKVEMKSDPAVASIDPGADQNFVGSSGYDITPKDANGNEIKSLNGSVTITIPYTDADVTSAGVDESKLQVASFNTSSQTWETFSTTVDTTNNLLIASVSHFSSFGVLGGVRTTSVGSSTTDLTAPVAPTNVRLTSDGSKVTLTWTDPTEADFYRVEVLRNDGNGTEVTGDLRAIIAKGEGRYVDTSVQAGKTYKYILKVRDTSLNQRLSEEYSIRVAVAAATTTPSAPAPVTAPAPSTTTPPSATPATPAQPTVTTATPATPSPRSTPSVSGVSETLRSGTHAYGASRVRTLTTEQTLARTLSKDLNVVLPGVFNRLFHQKTNKSKAWWYTYVNAYTYGGYTLEEIKQAVRFGGKTVHPVIPAAVWRGSGDYQKYMAE